jgi:acyl carrier protein
VLASRRAEPSPRTRALEERGIRVEYVPLDVTSAGALEALLQRLDAEGGLAGLYHLAVHLEDETLLRMSKDALDRTLQAKAGTAQRLDSLTQNRGVPRWVLFSSCAGLLGSPGQASYAAANAILDSIAAGRRARGLPATSAAISLIAPRDAAGRGTFALQGIAPLEDSVAVRAVLRAADAQLPACAVLRLDASSFKAAHPRIASRSLLSALMSSAQASADAPGMPMRERLERLPEPERAPHLKGVLRMVVKSVARVPVEGLGDDAPLQQFGLDSLSALELRNKLERLMDLRLRATLIFEHPTIDRLSAFLLERLGFAQAPAPAPVVVEDKGLEGRNTDELAAMLEAELSGNGVS